MHYFIEDNWLSFYKNIGEFDKFPYKIYRFSLTISFLREALEICYYHWSLNNDSIKYCRESFSKRNYKLVLKLIILNKESHKVSTSNILLATIGDDALITVTLSTSAKDIRIEKNSASKTPWDNQILLDTEWNALTSFLVE